MFFLAGGEVIGAVVGRCFGASLIDRRLPGIPEARGISVEGCAEVGSLALDAEVAGRKDAEVEPRLFLLLT